MKALNLDGVTFREPRPIPLAEYRRARLRPIGEGTWASLNRTESRRMSAKVWRRIKLGAGIVVVVVLGYVALGDMAQWLVGA